QETFNAAIDVCMPYYFPQKTLEKGRALLSHVAIRYQASVWWQRKAVELNSLSPWVPEQTPTVIIGAKYDCMCPFSLFQKDTRFPRSNIDLVFIETAGHFPWVENPAAVKKAFKKLVARMKE